MYVIKQCQTFRITFWLAALWVLPLLWFLLRFLLLLLLFLLFLCRQDTRHFDYLFNNIWFIFGKHAVVKKQIACKWDGKESFTLWTWIRAAVFHILFHRSVFVGAITIYKIKALKHRVYDEYITVHCFRVSSNLSYFHCTSTVKMSQEQELRLCN